MSDPFGNWVKLFLPMSGENNGTIFSDHSLINKTITPYGDVKTKTDQYRFYGSSSYFDGSGDFVTFNLPEIAGYNGDLCIEVLFYLNALPTGTAYNNSFYILGGGPTHANPGVDLALGNSAIWFNQDSYFDRTLSGAWTPDIHRWYSLALDKIGNSWSLRLDGSLIASATSSVAFNSEINTVAIGRCEPPGGEDTGYFNGYMQDLRITIGPARHFADFTPDDSPFDDPVLLLVPRGKNKILTRDMVDGGDGEFIIADPFTLNGTPFSGKLRAFDERSGRLVRQMYSNAIGATRMQYLNRNQEYLIVGYDGNDYPALAYDHQIPTKMS